MALVFAILVQSEIWVFTSDDGFTAAVRLGAAILTLVASGALAYRRTHPAAGFLVNGVAVIATILVGYPSDIYQWTNLVALYSLGAYATGWKRWGGLALGVTGVLTYFARFPTEGGPAIAAFAASMWVVAWLAGRTYGARVEEIQLRAERDVSRRLVEAQEARLVLEEERNRIARDLHDIVGHTVNVMVVHAEAGRRAVDTDHEQAVRAFDTIASTGRNAMEELDRVLAVLRGDEGLPDRAHMPGIRDLPRLAESLSETRLAVDVTLDGDHDGVPPSVGLAVYRIAQEALTNVLKHASASHAQVTVDVGRGEVQVRVADDGIGDPAGIEAGRGIAGMRERAALHGGGVDLGSDESGRFVVTARLRWDVA